MMLVRTDGSAGTQAAVQKALAEFPTQKVQTKTEYLDAINKQVDEILMMFYGLLAMSVIISIFGIVNTLVLSVHERTRESVCCAPSAPPGGSSARWSATRA